MHTKLRPKVYLHHLVCNVVLDGLVVGLLCVLAAIAHHAGERVQALVSQLAAHDLACRQQQSIAAQWHFSSATNEHAAYSSGTVPAVHAA
jgi:hypothetical protein